MKQLNRNLAGVILLCGFAVHAESAFARNLENLATPETVTFMPQDVFAPTGFDDNDESELVVVWELPSSCYTHSKIVTQVDPRERVIRVGVSASYFDSHWCSIQLKPVYEKVSLGKLKAGQYTVAAYDSDRKFIPMTRLSVAASQSGNGGIDDHIYAEVKSIQFKRPDQAVIDLQFPADCLELSEFQTRETASRLVEVMPILRKKDGPVKCTGQMTSLIKDFGIPTDPNRSTLIYARSNEGKSVASLFSPFVPDEE